MPSGEEHGEQRNRGVVQILDEISGMSKSAGRRYTIVTARPKATERNQEITCGWMRQSPASWRRWARQSALKQISAIRAESRWVKARAATAKAHRHIDPTLQSAWPQGGIAKRLEPGEAKLLE
jgi:hypothetical protein